MAYSKSGSTALARVLASRQLSEVVDAVEQFQQKGIEVYVDQPQGIYITSGVVNCFSQCLVD